MLLKEIFSRKKKSLEENLQSKILNTKSHAKSYIRTRSLSNHYNEVVVDNNNVLLSLFKNKVKTSKRIKGNTNNYKIYFPSENKNFVKPVKEGQSINTPSFFYKNRKNDCFKFRYPILRSSMILRSSICNNHIDKLRQSIEGLKHSSTWSRSSLLILAPKRGGFSCYASGILGFLPKRHGNSLFCKTLLFLLKDEKMQKRLKNVLFITCKKSSGNASFLLRLHGFLGKFRFVFRKKRRKFSLSRKKKNKKNSYRKYTMIFLSNQIK
jgi:hypothetical protein